MPCLCYWNFLSTSGGGHGPWGGLNGANSAAARRVPPNRRWGDCRVDPMSNQRPRPGSKLGESPASWAWAALPGRDTLSVSLSVLQTEAATPPRGQVLGRVPL